jgi:hypothetical protein
MAGSSTAHDDQVMLVQEFSSLLSRRWNYWSNITTDVKEYLLNDGCVQSSRCNSNFIESVRITEHGFCQINTFSCWQSPSNDDTKVPSVSLDVNC